MIYYYLRQLLILERRIAVIFTDLLFLLAFLPISAIVMLVLGENWEKNTAVLLLSLVFFAWGRPLYILLILLPTALTYISARFAHKSKALYVIGGAVSALFGLVLACLFGAERTLTSGVTAAAMLLYSLKAFGYLRSVASGKEAEKDFLSLAVYLISYEFFLFNPCLDYGDVSDRIKNRRIKLSYLAVGMQSVVQGLAQSVILGLSLDRVRTAALLSGATPWGNLVIGTLAFTLETYVILNGFMKVSCGLCMINGIPVASSFEGIMPRLSLKAHLGDIHPDLCDSLDRHLSGNMLLVGLTATCITAGVGAALGVGTAATLGLISAGVLLISVKGSGLFEKIFALILAALGFLLGAIGGIDGFYSFDGMLGYGFDMSYALFDELSRVAPWLVIALFCVTPMPRILATMWRERMAASPAAYSALRVISTVWSILLLGVTLLAMIGFTR